MQVPGGRAGEWGVWVQFRLHKAPHCGAAARIEIDFSDVASADREVGTCRMRRGAPLPRARRAGGALMCNSDDDARVPRFARQAARADDAPRRAPFAG